MWLHAAKIFCLPGLCLCSVVEADLQIPATHFTAHCTLPDAPGGDEANVSVAEKPGIYIDGGIHAREWIAPAVVRNILLNVLHGWRSRAEPYASLVPLYNWAFVPILNVDGYRFTFTNNRMWRKTRRDNLDGSYGVDANRNADVDFCKNGASSVPSSDSYCGPFPFSEPCMIATRDYVAATRGNIKIYWNMHSYGQEIILPYAYSPTEVRLACLPAC